MKVGNTPLVWLDGLSRQLDCNLYAKLEYMNPTGSHKDREMQAVVEDMKRRGFKECAVASSGNAALSLSYFCWCENFQCHIFGAQNDLKKKRSILDIFRPIYHLAPTYERSCGQLTELCLVRSDIYNANAGVCPVRIEADGKIIAELEEVLPDVVICPVNNGTLYLGLKNAITPLSKPRLVGVKAEHTQLASSLHGFYNREQVTDNIIEVGDNDIRWATKELCHEGFIVEPSSATTLAGVKKLNEVKGKTVVLILTGNGLKYPSELAEALK